MQRKSTQRLAYLFGISMAVLMVASLFLPALSQNVTEQAQSDPAAAPTPTLVPAPTFPPPITDFSTISFDEDYLHPSGLFAIGIPDGWTPNSPINNSVQAQINLSNPNAVSVIETYIMEPQSDTTTLEDLSNRFNQSMLSSSWSNYTTWNELARRQDEENNRLLIDFQLSRTGQQFLARHAAWADENWIYVVRVVVPENARDLLFWMLDAMSEQIKPVEAFYGTPLGWEGYFDNETEYIFRHPQDWVLTDGSEGRPASFRTSDGSGIIVAPQDGTVESEDDAAAWVTDFRSSAEVLSVEPTTRNGASGYEVAYTYSTPDGESVSGKVVLLNTDDGRVYSANAVLPPGSAVDLNTEDGRSAYSDVATALDTFTLLTGLNLPQPETPEPTATPEVEPDAEEAPAEDEATEEPEAEATDEPEAEATEES